VVVHAGHDLQLSTVIQLDAAHHVHLPQLHRTIPLEAAELVASLASATELDQAMALETPVDARAAGHRLDASLRELMLDAPWSPSRVLASQLADLSLDLGRDLMRTRARTVRAIGQSRQTSLLVPRDPGVHALARDAKTSGDLRDLPAVLHDRQHGLVPLLHDAQLHEHAHLLGLERGRDKETGAPAGVKHQPECAFRRHA
jgi:hypothetical protein